MSDPVLPVSASHLVLRSRQLEMETVRHLARRAELVDVIGQLIRVLQRERGASAIYLASKAQRFVGERRKILDEVTPLEVLLRHVFAEHSGPAMGATGKTLSLMAWTLLGIESLPALRGQIERQCMSPHDAVAAYSQLIAGLIELVFHVADGAALPSVSRLLVALLHLVQAQEEAAQERAMGALLYASGTLSEVHQQRVLHLIDAQDRSLRVFGEFAEPALRARWEQAQLAAGLAELERLRRMLCVARSGAVLDSDLSNVWFEVCSGRIDALWHLQLELVKRLREDCEESIVQAQQDLLDSGGLLRGLRNNPPPRTHAVDRFFDLAANPASLPEPLVEDSVVGPGAGGETDSLMELLRAQSARMARIEAELEAARRTLHERKIIERAKGVLMARLGMNEDVAFRALQKTSMDQNRRLVEVAEATLSLPHLNFALPAAQP